MVKRSVFVRVFAVVMLLTAVFATAQSQNAATVVGVNDWYNPAWGGGFNASFEYTLSDADVPDGSLETWSIVLDYQGTAQLNSAWMSGYNGNVSTGNSGPNGEFVITNENEGFKPTLISGSVLNFTVSGDGGGFDEADFLVTFSNLDAPETNDPIGEDTPISSPVDAVMSSSYVAVNDWYNPVGGGGFNATYECVVNSSDPVTEVFVKFNYTGSGTPISAWAQSYNGSINYGFISADGGFALAGEGASSPLQQGDRFQVVVQVDGAGFDEADFDVSCATQDNAAPIADAGSDISVAVGTEVTLDGSTSTDADGDSLTFNWDIVDLPQGSVSSLSDPDGVMTSFVVDQFGDYRIRLIVNDGTNDSPSDEVVVSTINSDPVANAGPDQQVFVGDQVVLDGSESTDDDGDTIDFAWSLVSAPQGSAASLSVSDEVRPEFVPDLTGEYLFELVVSDDIASSDPDAIVVNVETMNTVPVADAGQDQTAVLGSTVVLSGANSQDADGNSLTYQWSVLSQPESSTSVPQPGDGLTSSLLIDSQGDYLVQLVVNDGLADSDPSTILISTSNSKPVAEITAASTGTIGQAVLFDSTASNDPDADTLFFDWSILSRPAESTIEIEDPEASSISLTPDSSGLYVIQLIVSDGVLSSDPVTHSVQVTPAAETLAISDISPASDTVVASDAPLTLTISVNQPVTGSVDNQSVVSDADNVVTVTVELEEGANTFNIELQNAAGESLTQTITLFLDTVAPAAPSATDITVTATETEVQVVGITGSVEAGSAVTITNLSEEDSVTVTATEDGSFEATVAGSSVDDIEITLEDSVMNQSDAIIINGTSADPSNSSTISGVVSTSSDSPIGGATVTALDRLTGDLVTDATTAADGTYALVVDADTEYVLNVNATDYADQIVVVESTSVDSDSSISIVMFERSTPVSFDEDIGGQFEGESGAAVTVGGNSFEEVLGTNPVTVNITPIDPSGQQTAAVLPGETNGSTGGASDIDHIGAVEIVFENTTGQTLDLLPEATAVITIPIFVNNGTTPLTVGNTVPVWSLNETAGVWEEEGVGTIVANTASSTGLAVEAEVSHFTYYSIGESKYLTTPLEIMLPAFLAIDTDGDGVPDIQDAFPGDFSDSRDSDGDGIGDNTDAFPNDPGESFDSDYDGVGDNSDAFPLDATESVDSDGDGVGDSADALPEDNEPPLAAAESTFSELARFQATGNRSTSTDENEMIDTYNGGIYLNYVDAVVPGSGGFDLPIYRTYSSGPADPTQRFMGRQWDIHFGRIVSDISLLDFHVADETPKWFCPTLTSERNNPVFEAPDGSRHVLYLLRDTDRDLFGAENVVDSSGGNFNDLNGSAFNSPELVTETTYATTRAHHKVVCNTDGTVVIHSPDGMKYFFGTAPHIKEGRALLTDRVIGPNNRLYATKIQDNNGNKFEIDYLDQYIESDGQIGSSSGPVFTIEKVRGDGVTAIFKYETAPGEREQIVGATPNVVLSDIKIGGRTVVEYEFEENPLNGLRGLRQTPNLDKVSRKSSSTGSTDIVWEYGYFHPNSDNDGNQLETITKPAGGVVTYTYQDIEADEDSFGVDSGTPTIRAIHTKKLGSLGEWSYSFDGNQTDKYRQTTIEGPNNTRVVHKHCSTELYPTGCEFRGYVAQTKVFDTTTSVKELQSTNIVWGKGRKITDQNLEDIVSPYAPVLLMRSETRENVVLTKMYSSFDDFGNPKYLADMKGIQLPVYSASSASTSNSFGTQNANTRYTEFEYKNDTNTWMLGLAKEIHMKDLSEITFESAAQLEEFQPIPAVPRGPSEHKIEFEYYSDGNIKSVGEYGYLTQYTYHANGDVKTIIDPNGNTTSLTNYKFGIPQTEQQSNSLAGPLATTITRVVNLNTGLINSQTVYREAGVTFEAAYNYDNSGRVTSIETPRIDDSDISIVYRDASTTLTRGTLTRKVDYDDFGRTELVTVSGTNVDKTSNSYKYDAWGNLTEQSKPYVDGDATIVKSFMTYDALGRIDTERYNTDLLLGKNANNKYNYNGLTTTITDRENHITTLKYRAYGEFSDSSLIESNHIIEGTQSVKTSITRSLRGDAMLITQGSATREYKYDGAYRVKQAVHPEVGAIDYGYDSNGNLVSERYLGSSSSTTYKYDGRNQIIYKGYGGITQGTTTQVRAPHATYEYYNDGSLKFAKTGDDSNGGADTSWTYNYDGNGNLISEELSTGFLGLSPQEFLISYSYDGLDSRSSIIYPSEQSIVLSPDELGRPTAIGDYLKEINYFASGQIDSATYGNGLIWDIDEDEYGLVEKNSVETVWSEAMEYTDRFNVLNHTRTVDDGHQVIKNYEYDGIGRIDSIQVGSGQKQYFEYDVNSNLKKQKYPSFNNRKTDVVYDTSKQLPVSGTSPDFESFDIRHDSRGNLTTSNGNEQLYTFDNANRLRHISHGDEQSPRVSYEYDAHGRRIYSEIEGEGLYTMYNLEGVLLHSKRMRDSTISDYIYAGRYLVARKDEGDPILPSGLLTNGGFEDDLNGWALCSSGGNTDIVEDSHDGAHALRIANGGCVSQEFNIRPEEQYSLRCFGKGSGNSTITVTTMDQESNVITSVPVNVDVDVDEYILYGFTFFAPANGGNGSVVLSSDGTVTFDSCYLKQN